MPYLGLLNGDAVLPVEVTDDVSVECPSCGRPMGVRSGHYSDEEFIPRHFFHYSNPDGCGGESPIHYKMKSIAAETLAETFENASIELEYGLGSRIADVVAILDTPVKPYGKGIVVEAQHKNEDKNIGAVGNEYLNHGFSVYWAYQSDFNEDSNRLEFSEKRLWTVWPEALPRELKGYPEPVEDLVARDEYGTLEMDIRLPDQYIRQHKLDILSPSQRDVVAPEWTHEDTVWLHSKANPLFWVNILSGPLDMRFIEFWTKDRQTNETDHLAISISQDDVDAIEQFVDEAGSSADLESTNSTNGIVRHVTVRLHGNRRTSGRLCLVSNRDGDLRLVTERQDRKGNRRSLSVSWKHGDDERLEQLYDTLA